MFIRNLRRLAAVVLSGAVLACEGTEPPAPVATVSITPGQSTLVSLGETMSLSAVAKDAAGNELADRPVSWTTDAAGVATVSPTAVVTAVANGQATITATVEGVSATATLTVAQAVASVIVTPAAFPLASINETVQLAATPLDALGNSIAGKTATWSTSAAGVATVSAGGEAKAVTNGAAIVTATVDGKTATSAINVAQVPAKLAFMIQPRTTQKGVTLPGVAVRVQDALGTTVTSGLTDVAIAIGTNPANGAITGPTQKVALNGVATFSSIAIDNAGVGYTLSATASGLAGATSSAFEIMNVAARIDSMHIVPSAKIGTSATYTLFVTNGAGRNLTSAGIQGYVVQNGVVKSAGSALTFGCAPTAGVVPHGTCTLQWSLSLNVNGTTFTPGASIARVDFYEGPTTHGTITAPITLVP